jgi:hypothetical protein
MGNAARISAALIHPGLFSLVENNRTPEKGNDFAIYIVNVRGC